VRKREALTPGQLFDPECPRLVDPRWQSEFDLGAVHQHCDIGSEYQRRVWLGTPERRIDSLDSRGVLRIGEQGHLGASVALQLGVREDVAAEPSLRDTASDVAIDAIEASPQHRIGYLTRRWVTE
jgi:hypothetical protein